MKRLLQNPKNPVSWFFSMLLVLVIVYVFGYWLWIIVSEPFKFLL